MHRGQKCLRSILSIIPYGGPDLYPTSGLRSETFPLRKSMHSPFRSWLERRFCRWWNDSSMPRRCEGQGYYEVY